MSSKNIEKCRRKYRIKDHYWSYLDKKRPRLFLFLLHLSIFLLEILNITSQLSHEAMIQISSKNIEKLRRKSKKRPILVIS